jgi:hypothetical protein
LEKQAPKTVKIDLNIPPPNMQFFVLIFEKITEYTSLSTGSICQFNFNLFTIVVEIFYDAKKTGAKMAI